MLAPYKPLFAQRNKSNAECITSRVGTVIFKIHNATPRKPFREIAGRQFSVDQTLRSTVQAMLNPSNLQRMAIHTVLWQTSSVFHCPRVQAIWGTTWSSVTS